MRSISPMARILIIAGLLAGLVLLTALSLPGDAGAVQNSDPTPTLTPTLQPDEEPIKSEDTDNMVLGAAAILLTIITGVTVQRILLKKKPEFS